jgi:hypothetical protein
VNEFFHMGGYGIVLLNVFLAWAALRKAERQARRRQEMT